MTDVYINRYFLNSITNIYLHFVNLCFVLRHKLQPNSVTDAEERLILCLLHHPSTIRVQTIILSSWSVLQERTLFRLPRLISHNRKNTICPCTRNQHVISVKHVFHTYMHTYIPTDMCACIHAYIYTNIHTCIHTHLYIYLSLSLSLSLSLCVCVCGTWKKNRQ